MPVERVSENRATASSSQGALYLSKRARPKSLTSCFQINPAERSLRQSFCPKIHKDGKRKPGRAVALEGLLAVPVSIRSVERTRLCQPELNELHTELNQMLVSISQPSSLPWQTVNSLHTTAGGKVRNAKSWGMHSLQTLLDGPFMDLCSPSATSYLL